MERGRTYGPGTLSGTPVRFTIQISGDDRGSGGASPTTRVGGRCGPVALPVKCRCESFPARSVNSAARARGTRWTQLTQNNHNSSHSGLASAPILWVSSLFTPFGLPYLFSLYPSLSSLPPLPRLTFCVLFTHVVGTPMASLPDRRRRGRPETATWGDSRGPPRRTSTLPSIHPLVGPSVPRRPGSDPIGDKEVRRPRFLFPKIFLFVSVRTRKTRGVEKGEKEREGPNEALFLRSRLDDS